MIERKPVKLIPAQLNRAAIFLWFLAAVFSGLFVAPAHGLAQYKLPDTGQTRCYDNTQEIPCPQPGERFYGQDANYTGPPAGLSGQRRRDGY